MAESDRAGVVLTWLFITVSVCLVIYIFMVLYAGYLQPRLVSGGTSSIHDPIGSGSMSSGSDPNRMTRKSVHTTPPVRSYLPVSSARASAQPDAEQEVDSEEKPASESGSEAGAKPLEEIDDSDYEPDAADKKAALPVSETAAERSARMIRETLGIKEPEAPQAAVIVELMLAESCETKAGLETSLPILYRFESPTIRTSSVNELRSLLSQYRSCEKSEFHMMLSGIETSEELALMRFNELKYFFTQNSVPKSALHYYDTP